MSNANPVSIILDTKKRVVRVDKFGDGSIPLGQEFAWFLGQYKMNDQKNKSTPGIVALSITLGLSSLVFTILGLWLLWNSDPLYGFLSVCIAGLSGAAGWGLNRQKKWGVVLFGLIGLLSSINHLANTLTRYSDLSQAGVARVLGALFSLILAIFIPVGVIYLVILLWRRL